MLLRQLIQAMIIASGVERIGDQHGVFERTDGDAITRKHQQIIFHIMRDLENSVVLEQRLQPRQRLIERNLPGDEIGAAKQIA